MKKLCTSLAAIAVLGVSLMTTGMVHARVLQSSEIGHTASQLLQIALQDNPNISYRGLDGDIGSSTIKAIKKWQSLNGKTSLDPLDHRVVCALIKEGVKGHGSGGYLPTYC